MKISNAEILQFAENLSSMSTDTYLKTKLMILSKIQAGALSALMKDIFEIVEIKRPLLLEMKEGATLG
jgi:hypothetical protein